MNTKIRVLAIDDNINMLKNIEESFRSHAVIEVVKMLSDSNEAYEYIMKHNNEFDFVLMDLIMPGKDGIDILEMMAKKKINKKVILLTSISKEKTVDMTRDYHIDYYIMKPFSKETLEKRIIMVMKSKVEENEAKRNVIELSISRLLHSLGIPSHIKGYQYIRESISLIYHHPELLGGITKEVYPEIASRFETTSSRVERAIRHAIEVSWARGDYDLMEEIFGHSVDYDRAKPTNSEFIATIADKLRIDSSYIHA